jgi:hypothetical protein
MPFENTPLDCQEKNHVENETVLIDLVSFIITQPEGDRTKKKLNTIMFSTAQKESTRKYENKQHHILESSVLCCLQRSAIYFCSAVKIYYLTVKIETKMKMIFH